MLIPIILASVLVTSDNYKIAYTHYDKGHKQVVVIAHGFFNSKDAALLQELKDNLIDTYDVIMFDFRGHGESSGLFTWTSKESAELGKILDYAKAKYEKIGLIGFSLGAAISIEVLSRKTIVDSFIAVAAPSEFRKIDYRFWELDFQNDIVYNLGEGKRGKGLRPGPFWLKKPKPIELVEKIKIPILYIHGDKDWVIRHTHSERLYERTKSKKEIRIIKDGLHAEYLMRKHKEEFVEYIRNWFRMTILEGS